MTPPAPRRPDGPVPEPESPWRLADFRVLFAATALSFLGYNIGYIALPLIAVTTLHASPAEVGVLSALSTVAFLVIGLPTGALVDRMRSRVVLIVADLVRAALFGSVPLAWWLGVLTLPQLYAVVLLNGAATVFFDVTSQSALPQIVGRAGLVRANAALVGLMAAGNLLGRSAGGGLAQLLTAPAAVVCTAVSFLSSALRLTALSRQPAPDALGPGRPPAFRHLIAEGITHVLGNAELRALALTGALTNLGVQVVNTMLPVLFVRRLGLPAGALGLFWAAGAVGLYLGSRRAHAFGERLGYGRALAVVGVCLAPAALLVPLAGHGVWLYVSGAGWLVATAKTGVDNVLGVSLRQRLTPYPLLGRMNATFRFLLMGAFTAGSALSGLIGQLASVRAALWTGGVIMALAFLPVFLSPVRSRRALPPQAVADGSGMPSGQNSRHK